MIKEQRSDLFYSDFGLSRGSETWTPGINKGIQIMQQEQKRDVQESLKNTKRNLEQIPWNVT